MPISKYDPGQELSSLDFGNLIGGPLSAVVDAQIRAAESTVAYIKDVGFDENGDPNYVTFTYPKEISPYVAGSPHSIRPKIVNKGLNYNVVPYIIVEGDGAYATAEAIMEGPTNNMTIKDVVITNQGRDYTSCTIKVLPIAIPTTALADGDIEVLNVSSTDGRITEVKLNNLTTNGYSHPPIIELEDTSTNPGTGAKLEAILDQEGKVVEVQIIDGGSGYFTIANIKSKAIQPSGKDGKVEAIFTSGIPSQAAQFTDMKLEVPLLTMVPIPYIRVEETTINFNAKINSVERVDTESSFEASMNFSTEKDESYSGTRRDGKVVRRKKKTKYKNYSVTNYSGNRKTKFNVSASYKRTNSRNTSIEKTYTMGVQVKATQEEIPAGMEKVLGILENSIVSQPM